MRVPAARTLAGAGVSLLCLGGAALLRPAPGPPFPESGPAAPGRPPPGARLSDGAVAALPVAARRLLADASWLLAVQHYGGRRLAAADDFPRLGPLIENALRLDPNLRPAAVTGALLLAEASPLGAGEPRRADRLLAAWVRRRPGDYEAILLRALLHHWHLDDPAGAVRILAAARAAGTAPPWLDALAARSLTEIGQRQAARRLWRALLEQASEPRARANARTHLLQLDALDELDRLRRLAAEFERQRGRPPRVWGDLVAAGLLPAVPRDPAGVPFVLDGGGAPDIARDSPLAGIPRR